MNLHTTVRRTKNKQGTVRLAPEEMMVDNYSLLPACPHLGQVLEKARDNVISTYRQAVSITRITPDATCVSRKDNLIVASSKLMKMKALALRCGDCDTYAPGNFICLQCPHVGCETHALTHSQSHNHLFGIDLECGLMYCFSCHRYTNNEDLDCVRLNREPFNYELTHYLDPSLVAMTGLKGFVNLGATCYMSLILQTFIHNPLFKECFLNNDFHYFHCEKNKAFLISQQVDENNACITCALDNIFTSFYTATLHEGFGLTHLLLTAWYKKKLLAGFQEQDAHEFWQFILNELHSDHERLVRQLNIKQEEGKSIQKCSCVTHRTFLGELSSSIKCTSCGSITSTTDPVLDVSLELKKGSTKLYNCLDLFCRDEPLDVPYTCELCNDKTEAIKLLRLKLVAPVFSIQLKRFKHHLDLISKIDNPIEVPLYLELAKYCENPQGNLFYELFALVCHTGSVHTGHYVVIIKGGDGQWYKFDDSVITMVDKEEVTSTSAYLLFYIQRPL